MDGDRLRDRLDLVTTFDAFNAVVGLESHYELEARYAEPQPGPPSR